jgi:segregation and condensation protein B
MRNEECRMKNVEDADRERQAADDGEHDEIDAPAADVSVGDDEPVGDAAAEGSRSAAATPPEPVAEVRAGSVSEELKAVIEALIYASPDPLTPKTLFKVLESEPREDVQVSLDALRRDYAEGRGGLHLVEVAGGYQIVTRPELSEWVRRLFHERKSQKLSVAALETLAVVAYKQPITAPEITEIRGVNTAGVIATLLERRLVKIAGRKQVVGRPFLYATTREFLIRFGLRDLNDLPRMEDMADVLGFEPPSGLAEAGPSESLLPLDTKPDPDKTLDVDDVPTEPEPGR